MALILIKLIKTYDRKRIMKRIKLTLIYLFITSFSLIYAANEKQNLTKYVSAVGPYNAYIELNLHQLATKANLNGHEYKSNIHVMLNELTNDKALSDIIYGSLNQNNTALDFKSNTYIVLHGKKNTNVNITSSSLYIAVRNYKELLALVEQNITNGTPIQRENEFYILPYKPGNHQVAFNEDYLVIVEDRDRNELGSILYPTKTLNKSILSKHLNSKNDLTLFINSELLANDRKIRNFISLYLNNIENFTADNGNALYIAMGAKFNNGSVEIETNNICENPKALEELNQSTGVQKTSKKLTNYISDSTLWTTYLSLDGQYLSNTISKYLPLLPKVFSAQDLALAEKIAQTIDGDIAFSFEDFYMNGLFDFSFSAKLMFQTRGNDLFTLLKQSLKERNIKYTEVNDNLVSVSVLYFSVFIGKTKDMTYITTSSKFANDPVKVKPNIKKARFYKGKQDFGFNIIDVSNILANPFIQELYQKEVGADVRKFSDNIDYIKTRVPSTNNNTLEIVLKDSSINSLEFILNTFK